MKHDPGNDEPYACAMCDSYETMIHELQEQITELKEKLIKYNRYIPTCSDPTYYCVFEEEQ